MRLVGQQNGCRLHLMNNAGLPLIRKRKSCAAARTGFVTWPTLPATQIYDLSKAAMQGRTHLGDQPTQGPRAPISDAAFARAMCFAVRLGKPPGFSPEVPRRATRRAEAAPAHAAQ